MKIHKTLANGHKLHPTIAVDFDGTVVEHKYPEIGRPLPGAIDTLLRLNRAGVHLILYTMRDKQNLQDAIDYLEFQGVELYGVNRNPDQASWTSSNKVYADLYIDDHALGCPMTEKGVDWITIC